MSVFNDVCKECGGSGHHLNDCYCKSPVEVIMGCCVRCGGEGLVTVEPKGILDQHGKPIRSGDDDEVSGVHRAGDDVDDDAST